MKVHEFEKKINYKFKNKSLIDLAFTHSSYKNKTNTDYERLEFLGDRVLSLVLSEYLFLKYPKENEGALSKLRALPLFSDEEANSSTGDRLVSHHIGDRMLKDKCFQCHIDSPGKPGSFRSQGCAACHSTYSDDGLYKGEDPTISKVESGHPKKHRMIILIIC